MNCHRQGRRIEPEQANWSATSPARRIGFRAARWLGARTMGGRGLSSARLGLCRCTDGARPRKARPRRDRLSGWARASRHAQLRRRAGRGDAGERSAPDRQQRGRALFRQQAHHGISARSRSTRWSRRCAAWGAISATSTPGSPAGIIRRWPARWPARCWRKCRKAENCCAPRTPPDSTAAGSTR